MNSPQPTRVDVKLTTYRDYSMDSTDTPTASNIQRSQLKTPVNSHKVEQYDT